ncbi:MAG TPA: hypothetical protein VGZ90_05190 [Puia sp.]|jgi:hypothetical protein|nr:hypothetical protein [Puia sp.]
MAEETNDNIPTDPEKKMPDALDIHLHAIMHEKDLNRFREQLPSEFLSDASEGLDHLNDSKQLESVLQQLNQQMHQHLKHKKVHKRIHYIGNLSWTYWAIITIFLLTIIGFIVIRMLLHR